MGTETLTGPEGVTELVTVIKTFRDLGAVGGWALLALFVYGLATKRVAWWYQVQEERDRFITAIQEERARYRKLEDRCETLEGFVFQHLRINERAVEINKRTVEALSSPRQGGS